MKQNDLKFLSDPEPFVGTPGQTYEYKYTITINITNSIHDQNLTLMLKCMVRFTAICIFLYIRMFQKLNI